MNAITDWGNNSLATDKQKQNDMMSEKTKFCKLRKKQTEST